MQALPTPYSQAEERLPLPPFPRGWFALAFSKDIPKGRSVMVPYLGHPVTLTRSQSGELQGRNLPGSFTNLVETHGAVLHFIGTEGQWKAPHADSEGWSEPQCQQWFVDTHPQEILENTVDTAHFKKVHGYESLSTLGPIHFKGPIMRAQFEVTRLEGLFGKWDRREIKMHLNIEASGLGYSKVEIEIPQLAMRARQVVMPTPQVGGGVKFFATTQVQYLRELTSLPKFINRLIPRRLIAKVLATIAARGMANDVQQDFSIWENKRYVHPPLIVREDGPIGLYRKWASQFYAPSGLWGPNPTPTNGVRHVH